MREKLAHSGVRGEFVILAAGFMEEETAPCGETDYAALVSRLVAAGTDKKKRFDPSRSNAVFRSGKYIKLHWKYNKNAYRRQEELLMPKKKVTILRPLFIIPAQSFTSVIPIARPLPIHWRGFIDCAVMTCFS